MALRTLAGPGLPGSAIADVEMTRRWLAFIALVGYLVLIAAVVLVGWIGFRLKIDDVLKVVTTVAGLLGGIVGAIIGFYFRDVKS
jgi:uncharacterized membrane protein